MLWLVACAPRLPSARLDTVELTDLGWEQAGAEVRLIVDNPLPVAVPITSLRWAMDTNGRPLLSGATRDPISLAPDAETPVPIPVRLRYADLASAPGGEDAHLTVSIELDAGRPITLELERDFVLPDLTPPSLSLVSMTPSWDGAIGRLGLVVGVGLPAWVGIGRLDWSVDADDRRLGSGSAALGADRHLVLEVAVDPAAMAATSWDAWRGRLTRLHLEARGSVETGYGVLPLSIVRDLVLATSPG